MIPLSAPDISEREVEAVAAVLRSSRLSLGPKLGEFEEALARYIGVSHAVGVSSGTAGLHLCMRASGIREGDEVIVPSFTFVAAANAIRYERATPVFVDIDPRTLNLDPERVEAAVTPRTRAIVVVHTFGYPAAMKEILDLADRRGLLVFEDACEAIGAECDGRKVGGFGTAGVFGFYPNKQITTGEGGAVVTRDGEFAKKVKALRNQGRYDTGDWLQHEELGFNYRLSELNCALGLAQLQRIEEILRRRETVARQYAEHLSSLDSIVLPQAAHPHGRISWFVYVVRLAERFTRQQRDAVIRQLTSRGIQCGRYFAPVHRQPCYADWAQLSMPVTESASARSIALPFFNALTSGQIAEVAEELRSAVSSLA